MGKAFQYEPDADGLERQREYALAHPKDRVAWAALRAMESESGIREGDGTPYPVAYVRMPSDPVGEAKANAARLP